MISATREHICEYLTDVKRLIREDKYQIEFGSSRLQNRELFFEYVIDEEHAKNILLSLNVEDFSEIRQNKKPEYSHEKLYIFGKDVELVQRFGNKKVNVHLYIKFNKIDRKYLIVISLHEQEYKLIYPFRV